MEDSKIFTTSKEILNVTEDVNQNFPFLLTLESPMLRQRTPQIKHFLRTVMRRLLNLEVEPTFIHLNDGATLIEFMEVFRGQHNFGMLAIEDYWTNSYQVAYYQSNIRKGINYRQLYLPKLTCISLKEAILPLINAMATYDLMFLGFERTYAMLADFVFFTLQLPLKGWRCSATFIEYGYWLTHRLEIGRKLDLSEDIDLLPRLEDSPAKTEFLRRGTEAGMLEDNYVTDLQVLPNSLIYDEALFAEILSDNFNIDFKGASNNALYFLDYEAEVNINEALEKLNLGLYPVLRTLVTLPTSETRMNYRLKLIFLLYEYFSTIPNSSLLVKQIKITSLLECEVAVQNQQQLEQVKEILSNPNLEDLRITIFKGNHGAQEDVNVSGGFVIDDRFVVRRGPPIELQGPVFTFDKEVTSSNELRAVPFLNAIPQ